MKLLVCNALVCDSESPFNGKTCDIYIVDHTIESIEISSKKAFSKVTKGVKQIDVKGNLVSPGWFDLRADFCDPGFEYKEDLASGSNAALWGGFTDIALLPSTNPARDSKTGIDYVMNQSQLSPVDLHPYGSITPKREGKELAELFDMKQAGAVGFTDGNRPLVHAGILQRALLYAKIFDGLLLSSPDDQHISEGGRIHEGEMSTLLGLKGIPSHAEEIMVNRDIELVKYTAGKLHFSHISSKGSVDLIRKAKKQGLSISCDVAIANLCFTDEDLKEYDSNFKLYPPLRSKSDQKALWDGIVDGTIDAISSNHQPQNIENKEVEFEYAHVGMITLQTFLPMLLLNKPKGLSLDTLVKAITTNPRKILGFENISVQSGQKAKLVIFDPNQSWVFSQNQSKSKNTPFLQQKLNGKINAVVCKGKYHNL